MSKVITPQTTVAIYVSVPANNNPSGNMVDVKLPASALGIQEGEGVKSPELDLDALDAVRNDANLTGAEKVAKQQEIIKAFQAKANEYDRLGNVNPLDLIPAKVVDYLVEHYNFTKVKGEQKPYIDASDLRAAWNQKDEVLVTASAVWGGDLVETVEAEQAS